MPFSPGGTPDVFARLLGQQPTREWGQAVVVENRPGGNSIIASDAVAKAAPDGYTVLFTMGSFTINPAIYRKLPYDTLRDFAPVTQFYKSPGFVLVVNPKLPIHSVGDFIAIVHKLARKRLHDHRKQHGHSDVGRAGAPRERMSSRH